LHKKHLKRNIVSFNEKEIISISEDVKFPGNLLCETRYLEYSEINLLHFNCRIARSERELHSISKFAKLKIVVKSLTNKSRNITSLNITI
jgi:hypothetical protein